MLDAIRQWIEKISGDRRMLFLLGLIATGAFAIVLASGSFGLEFSQYFARYDENIDGGGGGGGGGGGTVPTDEDCNIVSSPGWVNASTPKCTPFPAPPALTPPPFPDNWKEHIELPNSGGLPSLATSAPYGGADGYTCFGFTLPDGNEWAAVDAHTGGTVPVPQRTHTLTGQFFNNCPWDVEMTGGAAVSPKAGSDFIFNEDGTIDEPWFGADNNLTRGTTQLIPSCWNYPHVAGSNSTPNDGGGGGGGRDGGPLEVMDTLRSLFGSHAYAQAVTGAQPGCTGEYSISFDVAFSAGRAEVNLGWKHHDGVGSAAGSATIIDGYTVIMDTGKDCTGAPGEFCATAASNSGGGGGTTGITGPGPGGAFNCGTGEGSDACWCGEWTDAIWAQRHYVGAVTCDPAFIITQELADYFLEEFEQDIPEGSIGKGASEFGDWSRGVVQEYIDIMESNFDGGNQSCTPRASGVDYAGIQEKYFAIYNYGGWGLSGNGTSAVARLCRDPNDEQSVLTASCPDNNEPPVLLEWNLPIGNVANGLLKRNATTGEDGSFISSIARLVTSYEDDDVEPGNTYVYTHKSSAAVASEPVEVTINEDGICEIEDAPTPTPTTTLRPTPTRTPTGTSTPAPTTVYVTITPPPDGRCEVDTDGDGICDDDECPTSGSGRCSDRDGDGIPDWADSGTRIGSAGSAQTGPGEATVLALLVASLTALLYVSYTHTNVFKEHEVERLGEDQDSMDFRQ